ncbi:MAG: hypothetical protein JRJ54_14630 [Deltaproteobacteria bacterium]|nr:hypothetical protein [Deltaproteobacteria bacterium]
MVNPDEFRDFSGQDGSKSVKAVQLNLFDAPTLNITLKETLNAVAKKSRYSREQILDRMNDLAARYGITLVKGNASRLNLDTFEKWLNPQDATRQMPLKALPVFCAAVGDASALSILAEPLGFKVIGPEEQQLLKWAQANISARRARKTMRRIEEDLDL